MTCKHMLNKSSPSLWMCGDFAVLHSMGVTPGVKTKIQVPKKCSSSIGHLMLAPKAGQPLKTPMMKCPPLMHKKHLQLQSVNLRMRKIHRYWWGLKFGTAIGACTHVKAAMPLYVRFHSHLSHSVVVLMCILKHWNCGNFVIQLSRSPCSVLVC